jgi:hypothetical protein
MELVSFTPNLMMAINIISIRKKLIHITISLLLIHVTNLERLTPKNLVKSTQGMKNAELIQ